jgi:hypothetical protein
MAMLLVVVTTEATDPARESGVAEEVRAGEIHTTSHHHMEPTRTDGTYRVHIFGRRR